MPPDAPADPLTECLRCPTHGGPLRVGADGGLVCDTGGESFPVRGGIPRFIESEHLASFGRQWNRYEVAHDAEDRATFEAKTGLPLFSLGGKTVLDAGCGGGRYCRVAAAAGATIFGADHTDAVDKAAALCADAGVGDRVHLVQADLKALPFAPASFDAVFSIGVMHHDADTRAVFDAVAAMVKPGGTLSVWLYRRNTAPQEWLNSALRRRTTRADPDRLERWCRAAATLGGVPVLGRTLNKLLPFSTHPDRENRVCDTFDWYAPAFQHHHTEGELTGWFDAAGFREITVLPPEKRGRLYRAAYDAGLLVGSGVNVRGVRESP